MNRIFRQILKILLILLCVNSYAETESIDAVIDAGVETVESLAVEAVEAVLSEENDAIIDEEFDEELLAEDQFEADVETVLSKDVVLVLDNSGSMKKNDPDFLVSKAVKEFISQQDEHTRVGVVIFDQGVRLPVALTISSLANRETILNSIEKINYKGLFTDSPAGIERAIYELKNNGRDSAQKSIIFMTDGIVDTGVPERDLEKSKWLREDLAPDAADNEIKIFGIAFTEAADFQLIQSIAQKTEGEYYRALTAADLQNVFEQIDKIINTPPEPEPEVVQVAPVIQAPAPIIQQAPPLPPVIIEVPAQSMGQEERVRSIIMIAAAIVLTITLLGILIILLRRNRDLKAGASESVQEGYINDLQGKTDKQTHKLGTKPVMFGRVAGKDTEHLDYIVVNETTIGRRHALIEYKDYSFWIIDQGSINGTFVNGEPVSTEVRLKHGDRIRLHKCDFEFIMPEMEDSGMTVISNTVFATQPEAVIDDSEEATQIRDHDGGATGELSEQEISTASASDMDFDLTGTDSAGELSDLYEPDPDDEDTIIREVPIDQGTNKEPEFTLEADADEFDSEDETIMLDDADADESHDELDDDATLRKDDH
jgi:pSer/pThr/pTyr-binding forkhead associated (FHA) protein/Mg-chelatase subunit ChlD